jgi:hypothetical protein
LIDGSKLAPGPNFDPTFRADPSRTQVHTAFWHCGAVVSVAVLHATGSNSDSRLRLHAPPGRGLLQW